VIACFGGRAVALDAFDRPETLTKLWPRLLSGYAMDAVGRKKAGLAPSAIQSFLASATNATTTSHEGLGLGMDVVITDQGTVGNALTWEEGVVHLAVFARTENDSRQPHRASQIQAPSRRERGPCI
jgi:hypothetical protein